MFCIIQESFDPFFNLAVEELLLKNSRKEYLILGINRPSVIVGKHQSVHREINTRFVVENNIPVIRRISGGGAVYHDMGNLNFAFIHQSEAGKQVDFPRYTKPVIDFLLSLGVLAKFEGKTDIKVDGFKISGNAEHVYRDRVLHHGTLLFSSSLNMLKNSLRNDTSPYKTRAVSSSPSSVMNLNDKIADFSDVFEFRSAMLSYILQNIEDSVPYRLTSSESDEAEILASEKYNSWEWNYAYGPEYTYRNSFHSGGIYHNCFLNVRDGIIQKCSIEGSDRMRLVAEKLPGCRHMVTDLRRVFVEELELLASEEVYYFF